MKKKLLGLIVVLVLAAVPFFGTVFVGAEDAAEKEEIKFVGTKAGFLSENIVDVWTDGALLDTYQAGDGTGNQPYPSDWGMKLGKVGDVFTFVDNDGARKDVASGFNLAAPMALSIAPKAGAEFEASATVTPTKKGDWGGVGIQIGWANKLPVGIFLHEGNALSISADGNDWAKAVTVVEGATAPTFAIGTAYEFKVTVINGTATAYVDGKLIGTSDVSSLTITPAVGARWKNYSADYTDFSLKVWNEALTLNDYKDLDNYFVDTIGLIDTYGAAAEFTTQQPFPSGWGLKAAKTEGGYYAAVNNSMEEARSDSHGVNYLATAKDVSSVSDYLVSATIKPVVRGNWGGVGLCVGRDSVTGAPVTVYANLENQSVYLGYNFEEHKVTLGTMEAGTFVLDKSFVMTVIVQSGHVAVFINDSPVGALAELTNVSLESLMGLDMKNYRAHYTDLTFKTTADELSAASYSAKVFAGEVQIGTVDYTYGEGAQLTEIPREGYKSEGFHLLTDLSDTAITEIPKNVGGNISFFTKYNLVNYTIKYYDGETEITDDTLQSSYNLNSYVGLPEIEKEGYTFIGWYESADFSGEAVEELEMGSSGDKVFYAKYESNKKDGDGGCKGSIVGTGAGLVVIGLAAIVAVKKRRGC